MNNWCVISWPIKLAQLRNKELLHSRFSSSARLRIINSSIPRFLGPFDSFDSTTNMAYTIKEARAWNVSLKDNRPKLVAVFVGATSGIGENTGRQKTRQCDRAADHLFRGPE
jgi:hypothetical protein